MWYQFSFFGLAFKDQSKKPPDEKESATFSGIQEIGIFSVAKMMIKLLFTKIKEFDQEYVGRKEHCTQRGKHLLLP